MRLYKPAAILLLLVAIAAVAMAFRASNERVAIQGPSALAVLEDGSVWLSVEESLWRFDAQGKRTAVVTPQQHGVHGLIGNLVVHPKGQLVASIKDDPHLYLLDAMTAAPSGKLLPQWPADLERHGARAITYAFHPDGRLAISTGGGHTVALFDAAGRFVGRTAPGLYQFSNGLWWSGDRLWTTDTNRFTLVELDGASLAAGSQVTLGGGTRGRHFLGMAARWEGGPAGVTAAGEPLATIVRFANGMIDGNVVDVLANGHEQAYPVPAAFEPRDVKWRAGELLVVDGASYSVKRFSSGRQALGDFGDAHAQDALAGSLLRREALQKHYYRWLGLAVLLFAAGALLAWRAQGLEKSRRLETLNVDLSQLGSRRMSEKERLAAGLQLVWPMLAAMGVLALYRAFPVAGWLGLTRVQSLAFGLGLVVAVATPSMIMSWRKLRNAASDPELDTLLNQAAVTALASTDAFWRIRESGEQPRETLMLTSVRGGRQWLVLTNQRLLVFAANLTDATLRNEHGRGDVVRARVLERGKMSRLQRLQSWLVGGAVLRFEFRDGTRLEGMTPSPQTAARLVALLCRAPLEATRAAPLGRAGALAPGQVADESEAQLQALASLLVPGLGQWMQQRGRTALLMFVPWLVTVLAVATPVVWTLWGPRAAVSTELVLAAAAAYVLMCALAAFDAWRMRPRGTAPV